MANEGDGEGARVRGWVRLGELYRKLDKVVEASESTQVPAGNTRREH